MAVWQECTRKVQKLSLRESDGFPFIENLMSLLEDVDLEQVCVIARRLWLRCNTVVFGGSLIPPIQLVHQGYTELDDFHTSLQHTSALPGSPSQRYKLSWQKPAVGTLKTNWDAALDVQNNKMGVGALIHDATGEVIAAMCSTVSFVNDPGIAEATTLWRTVSFCQALDIQRLHLEGDALEIVHFMPSYIRALVGAGLAI